MNPSTTEKKKKKMICACRHGFKYHDDPECRNIIPEVVKDWEDRFRETKFAKGGGLSFECSDYEGMYTDLLDFIASELSKARQEERERTIDEVFDELDKYDQDFYREMYRLMEEFADNPSNRNKYFTSLRGLMIEKWNTLKNSLKEK